MRRAPFRVPPFRQGAPILARDFEALRQSVLRLYEESPGRANNLNGWSSASHVMMRIKSSNGDYLTCRRYNGAVEETEDIEVAKPFELRPSVTALGSQTYSYTTDIERVATEGVDNETQVITPQWVINETVIWAVRANYTGVTGAGGDAISWLDANVIGRSWAKKAGT